MYAYRTSVQLSKPVDFSDEIQSNCSEIQYWRKHPNLHGWMESLYREKGGDGDFNCNPVELTSEDLDRLEEDIRNGGLPYTSGFFFGESRGDEEATDLAFVANARQVIAEGDRVFYDSWW
jgi:hypothetical protein